MLTRCPHCLTWFRVRAEHLSVAGGRVTCGQCETVFDALASLIEESGSPPPPPPVADSVAAAPPPAPAAPDVLAVEEIPRAAAQPDADTGDDGGAAGATDELDFDFDLSPATPEHAMPVAAAVEVPVTAPVTAAVTAADSVPALEFAIGGPPPQPTLSAADHAILFTAPGAQDDDRDDTVPEVRNAAAPAVLAAELAALSARPARRAAAWSVAAVLLFGAAGVQLAWIARAQVVQVLPASAAVFAWACARLACAPSSAARAPVRLLARDVREHPQYADALLVNATLINDASEAQPFPVIELRLHDATGTVLGARAFAPHEYLDQSIPTAAGMPPGRPVYVVMEIGRASAGAVSFEFTFL